MPLAMRPETIQNIQKGQENTPEWARILAHILPMLSPTGATGAALSMAPSQAQPQGEWTKILPLIPLLLGGIGMMRSGKGGMKGPEGEGNLNEFRSMIEGREDSGSSKAIPLKEIAEGTANFNTFVKSFLDKGYSQKEIERVFPGKQPAQDVQKFLDMTFNEQDVGNRVTGYLGRTENPVSLNEAVKNGYVIPTGETINTPLLGEVPTYKHSPKLLTEFIENRLKDWRENYPLGE